VGTRALPPFERFLREQRVPVMRFLLVAVGSDEADDVFQETFLAALRAYPRADDPAHLDRWILRIASRKAIDHHRRRATRAVAADAVPDGRVEPPPTPDDALWRAVGDLPPKQRLAVVHRHVLDRSYADVAAIMDTTEEAARASVSAGLKRLREAMA
jgi:RNA polymerase sigma factor (sigma-70 family)